MSDETATETVRRGGKAAAIAGKRVTTALEEQLTWDMSAAF
jgi:hypothetical protein